MNPSMLRLFALFAAGVALAGCSTGSSAPRPDDPSAQPPAAQATTPAAATAATTPAATTPAATTPAATPGAVDHQGADAKPTAPVELSLRASSKTGKVTVTLEITSKAEIPDARVRFVIPAGVSLLHGERETSLGALRKGESKTLSLALDVPAQGHFSLHAGVDVFAREGLKLHRAESIALGADPRPAEPTKVVPLPGGGGIRTSK